MEMITRMRNVSQFGPGVGRWVIAIEPRHKHSLWVMASNVSRKEIQLSFVKDCATSTARACNGRNFLPGVHSGAVLPHVVDCILGREAALPCTRKPSTAVRTLDRLCVIHFHGMVDALGPGHGSSVENINAVDAATADETEAGITAAREGTFCTWAVRTGHGYLAPCQLGGNRADKQDQEN